MQKKRSKRDVLVRVNNKRKYKKKSSRVIKKINRKDKNKSRLKNIFLVIAIIFLILLFFNFVFNKTYERKIVQDFESEEVDLGKKDVKASQEKKGVLNAIKSFVNFDWLYSISEKTYSSSRVPDNAYYGCTQDSDCGIGASYRECRGADIWKITEFHYCEAGECFKNFPETFLYDCTDYDIGCSKNICKGLPEVSSATCEQYTEIVCINSDDCCPYGCSISNDNDCETQGYCGDGNPDPGEECDDGDKCTIDSCNTGNGLCENTPKSCDDGNSCTVEVCNPIDGKCSILFDVNPCDDGNSCTKDICYGNGLCRYEKNQDINDGDSCTIDSCDRQTGEIKHEEISCDDGDPCTVELGCIFGECATIPKDCSDDNRCTKDSCNSEILTGDPCEHIRLTDEEIDDGLYCTVEWCDPKKGIVKEEFDCGLIEPNGDDPCTENICVEELDTCRFPDLKRDKLWCTDYECYAPYHLEYDNINDIYTRIWDEIKVRQPPRDCSENPNDDKCTNDKCNENLDKCEHFKKPEIDDKNDCTADICNAENGAITHDAQVMNGKACNDGNACTFRDGCKDSVCRGVLGNCPFGLGVNACNPANGNCFWNNFNLGPINPPWAGDCIPNCPQGACGHDGCGGDCGGCADGLNCVNGNCQACVPNCIGKTCGGDGCGGNCGECLAIIERCNNGQCCSDSYSECQEPDDCLEVKCENDDDCSNGRICVDGECIKECHGNPECRELYGDEKPVCNLMGKCEKCEKDCAGSDGVEGTKDDYNCGNDGCGGICGTCTDEEECIFDKGTEEFVKGINILKLVGKGICGRLCGIDSDCEEEEICEDYMCEDAECSENSECSESEFCEKIDKANNWDWGRCEPDECSDDRDCNNKQEECLTSDVNEDNEINNEDHDLISNNIGLSNCAIPDGCGGADLDGDGDVDISDIVIFQNNVGSDCSINNNWCNGADINKNEGVNNIDFSIILNRYQDNDCNKPGCDGADINNDGDVTNADLLQVEYWENNYCDSYGRKCIDGECEENDNNDNECPEGMWWDGNGGCAYKLCYKRECPLYSDFNDLDGNFWIDDPKGECICDNERGFEHHDKNGDGYVTANSEGECVCKEGLNLGTDLDEDGVIGIKANNPDYESKYPLQKCLCPEGTVWDDDGDEIVQAKECKCPEGKEWDDLNQDEHVNGPNECVCPNGEMQVSLYNENVCVKPKKCPEVECVQTYEGTCPDGEGRSCKCDINTKVDNICGCQCGQWLGVSKTTTTDTSMDCNGDGEYGDFIPPGQIGCGPNEYFCDTVNNRVMIKQYYCDTRDNSNGQQISKEMIVEECGNCAVCGEIPVDYKCECRTKDEKFEELVCENPETGEECLPISSHSSNHNGIGCVSKSVESKCPLNKEDFINIDFSDELSLCADGKGLCVTEGKFELTGMCDGEGRCTFDDVCDSDEPNKPMEESETKCDGFDNDCDGEVDEDIGPCLECSEGCNSNSCEPACNEDGCFESGVCYEPLEEGKCPIGSYASYGIPEEIGGLASITGLSINENTKKSLTGFFINKFINNPYSNLITGFDTIQFGDITECIHGGFGGCDKCEKVLSPLDSLKLEKLRIEYELSVLENPTVEQRNELIKKKDAVELAILSLENTMELSKTKDFALPINSLWLYIDKEGRSKDSKKEALEMLADLYISRGNYYRNKAPKEYTIKGCRLNNPNPSNGITHVQVTIMTERDGNGNEKAIGWSPLPGSNPLYQSFKNEPWEGYSEGLPLPFNHYRTHFSLRESFRHPIFSTPALQKYSGGFDESIMKRLEENPTKLKWLTQAKTIKYKDEEYDIETDISAASIEYSLMKKDYDEAISAIDEILNNHDVTQNERNELLMKQAEVYILKRDKYSGLSNYERVYNDLSSPPKLRAQAAISLSIFTDSDLKKKLMYIQKAIELDPTNLHYPKMKRDVTIAVMNSIASSESNVIRGIDAFVEGKVGSLWNPTPALQRFSSPRVWVEYVIGRESTQELTPGAIKKESARAIISIRRKINLMVAIEQALNGAGDMRGGYDLKDIMEIDYTEIEKIFPDYASYLYVKSKDESTNKMQFSIWIKGVIENDPNMRLLLAMGDKNDAEAQALLRGNNPIPSDFDFSVYEYVGISDSWEDFFQVELLNVYNIAQAMAFTGAGKMLVSRIPGVFQFADDAYALGQTVVRTGTPVTISEVSLGACNSKTAYISKGALKLLQKTYGGSKILLKKLGLFTAKVGGEVGASVAFEMIVPGLGNVVDVFDGIIDANFKTRAVKKVLGGVLGEGIEVVDGFVTSDLGIPKVHLNVEIPNGAMDDVLRQLENNPNFRFRGEPYLEEFPTSTGSSDYLTIELDDNQVIHFKEKSQPKICNDQVPGSKLYIPRETIDLLPTMKGDGAKTATDAINIDKARKQYIEGLETLERIKVKFSEAGVDNPNINPSDRSLLGPNKDGTWVKGKDIDPVHCSADCNPTEVVEGREWIRNGKLISGDVYFEVDADSGALRLSNKEEALDVGDCDGSRLYAKGKLITREDGFLADIEPSAVKGQQVSAYERKMMMVSLIEALEVRGYRGPYHEVINLEDFFYSTEYDVAIFKRDRLYWIRNPGGEERIYNPRIDPAVLYNENMVTAKVWHPSSNELGKFVDAIAYNPIDNSVIYKSPTTGKILYRGGEVNLPVEYKPSSLGGPHPNFVLNTDYTRAYGTSITQSRGRAHAMMKEGVFEPVHYVPDKNYALIKFNGDYYLLPEYGKPVLYDPAKHPAVFDCGDYAFTLDENNILVRAVSYDPKSRLALYKTEDQQFMIAHDFKSIRDTPLIEPYNIETHGVIYNPKSGKAFMVENGRLIESEVYDPITREFVYRGETGQLRKKVGDNPSQQFTDIDPDVVDPVTGKKASLGDPNSFSGICPPPRGFAGKNAVCDLIGPEKGMSVIEYSKKLNDMIPELKEINSFEQAVTDAMDKAKGKFDNKEIVYSFGDEFSPNGYFSEANVKNALDDLGLHPESLFRQRYENLFSEIRTRRLSNLPGGFWSQTPEYREAYYRNIFDQVLTENGIDYSDFVDDLGYILKRNRELIRQTQLTNNIISDYHNNLKTMIHDLGLEDYNKIYLLGDAEKIGLKSTLSNVDFEYKYVNRYSMLTESERLGRELPDEIGIVYDKILDIWSEASKGISEFQGPEAYQLFQSRFNLILKNEMARDEELKRIMTNIYETQNLKGDLLFIETGYRGSIPVFLSAMHQLKYPDSKSFVYLVGADADFASFIPHDTDMVIAQELENAGQFGRVQDIGCGGNPIVGERTNPKDYFRARVNSWNIVDEH